MRRPTDIAALTCEVHQKIIVDIYVHNGVPGQTLTPLLELRILASGDSMANALRAGPMINRKSLAHA